MNLTFNITPPTVAVPETTDFVRSYLMQASDGLVSSIVYFGIAALLIIILWFDIGHDPEKIMGRFGNASIKRKHYLVALTLLILFCFYLCIDAVYGSYQYIHFGLESYINCYIH